MKKHKPVKVAIIGYGQRGMDPYGVVINENKEKIELVAIADPDAKRLELAKKHFGNKPDYYFSGEDFLDQPQCADLVIVSTQDRNHYKFVISALDKGYNVLVEKPISPDLEECLAIVKKANECGRRVFVSHVLRYTPFYNFIKEAILNDEIGEFVSIQQIENVEYWHQAHSYVRGNWRNKKLSAPMILAKSCHDLDIILWLTGKNCRKVSSFGGLYLFREDKAPEGSAKRCVDCGVSESCPYNATEIYVNSKFGYRSGYRGWPLSVLTQNLDTDTELLQAIKEGPYGRCVYHCDNDVVDHQVVNMEFDGGITASFTMCAFTSSGGRTIKVMGTKGDITGDMAKNIIHIQAFGKPEKIIDINKLGLDLSGHAGGDKRLVLDIVDILNDPGNSKIGLTSIEYSVQSHQMAFAAEDSRLNGGMPVDIQID